MLRRHNLRVALILASALLLLTAAGCGRKGPLYLPDDAKRAPERTTPSK